jgi:hypothetical protein
MQAVKMGNNGLTFAIVKVNNKFIDSSEYFSNEESKLFFEKRKRQLIESNNQSNSDSENETVKTDYFYQKVEEKSSLYIYNPKTKSYKYYGKILSRYIPEFYNVLKNTCSCFDYDSQTVLAGFEILNQKGVRELCLISKTILKVYTIENPDCKYREDYSFLEKYSLYYNKRLTPDEIEETINNYYN